MMQHSINTPPKPQMDDRSMADRNRPLTIAAWDRLSELLIKISKGVKDAAASRLDECERRLDVLEQRPVVGVQYAGVFEDGKAYARGDLVTRRGGLWLALQHTATAPGTDTASWKLIVKSGRKLPVKRTVQ
jgi:hypothetical protein